MICTYFKFKWTRINCKLLIYEIYVYIFIMFCWFCFNHPSKNREPSPQSSQSYEVDALATSGTIPDITYLPKTLQRSTSLSWSSWSDSWRWQHCVVDFNDLLVTKRWKSRYLKRHHSEKYRCFFGWCLVFYIVFWMHLIYIYIHIFYSMKDFL